MSKSNQSRNHLLFLLISFFLLSKAIEIKLKAEKIELEEGVPYYKFILSKETDSYLMKLSTHSKIILVYVELLTLTGETDLEIVTPVQYAYNKYYASNKILYTISPGTPTGPFPDVEFNLKSLSQSYYSISYSVVTDDEQKNVFNIDSGINFLQTIEAKVDNKIKINLKNSNKENKLPYLVNFMSMNCDFSVVRSDDNELAIMDYYGQQLIKSDEEYYNEENYSYEVTVTAIDSTRQYQGERCFFYITGLEIQDELGEKKQIMVSENIEQDIIFKDGIKKVKYLYPHANSENSINVHLDLKELAVYNVKFYFNGIASEKTYEIARDQHIYLSKDDETWSNQCSSNEEICNIVVEISLVKTFEEENPTLLVIIETIPTFPAYLIKSEMLSDFLNGNQKQYFYTDIGPFEQGNVVINFLRGSGKVFARIVKINLEKPEENADWRGMYRFPQKVDESLVYDSYAKKIYFTPEDTQECDQGCFLLLTLISSIETSKTEEYIPIPFTMMVHSNHYEVKSQEMQIIRIPLEEFAIGNISPGKEDIMEFYSVWLDSDAEEVMIDWQTSAAGIYIKANNTRPSKYSTDFIKFSSGIDSVFIMSKKDIIKRSGDESRTTLKDMVLTIGIDTSKLGEVYTTTYKFKVRLRKKEINIYQVNSDQKVLCNTERTDDGTYRCLYAVLCSSVDVTNNLVIYPSSQKDNIELTTNVDLISYQNYEQWNSDYLINHIPTINARYSTSNNGLTFVYIPNGEKDNHFYISVYSDVETTIEMSTSFFTYESSIYPNPSTKQLFSFKQESVTFRFEEDNLLEISIESLIGKGRVYWEHDKDTSYYLNGKNDYLNLCLNPILCNSDSCNLIVENRNTDLSVDEPGYTFSIYYNVKSFEIDDMVFDELKYGHSVKIAYSNIRYPVILYSQIINITNPINVNLYYYNIEQNKHSLSLKDSSFDFQAMIITSEEMSKIKQDPSYIKVDKNSIAGVFNSGINSANIYLSEEDLSKFKVFNNAYLLVYITKSKEISDMMFNKFTLGTSISPINGEYNFPEKVGHFGKLDVSGRNTYKLLKNTKSDFMRIEFATNSDNYLGWSIRIKNDNENYKTNDTESIDFIKEEWINGRGILLFQTSANIYLNIFSKRKSNIKNDDSKLNNFFFRFIYTRRIDMIKEYRVEDDTIKFYQSNSSISFNRISNLSASVKVEYYIKIINEKEYVQNEKINTLAMLSSIGQSILYEDKDKSKDKIYTELNDVSINNKYLINIFAKIDDGSVCEYIAYNGLRIEIKQTIEDEDSSLVIFFICFAVFFVIVVIVLVIFLLKYRKENQNLMEQVRQTSFQNTSKDLLEEKENK